MQTDNRLLDDLARVATGALGALTGVRGEVEARIREQFERILARMDLVTREEFEAVREMASRARAEQEELQHRLGELEARLGSSAGGAPAGIVAAEPAVSRPVRRKAATEPPETPPVA
jgi:BMFP domain-containing protein YqiC